MIFLSKSENLFQIHINVFDKIRDGGFDFRNEYSYIFYRLMDVLMLFKTMYVSKNYVVLYKGNFMIVF